MILYAIVMVAVMVLAGVLYGYRFRESALKKTHQTRIEQTKIELKQNTKRLKRKQDFLTYELQSLRNKSQSLEAEIKDLDFHDTDLRQKSCVLNAQTEVYARVWEKL